MPTARKTYAGGLTVRAGRVVGRSGSLLTGARGHVACKTGPVAAAHAPRGSHDEADADADQAAGRGVTEQRPPVPPDVWAQQMREASQRMMSAWAAAAGSMAGAARAMTHGAGSPSEAGAVSAGGSAFDIPALPALPATFSAEKVQALLEDVADRRSQVQALRESLTAFDEQLGVMETGLRPMLEWAKGWSELEKGFAEFWRLPPGDSGTVSSTSS